MRSILVIEDETVSRHDAVRLAEQAGYAVIAAQNGKMGLRLFKAHRPDIVLTDMVMPEMDGFEVIRECRRYDPAVAIIVMDGSCAPRADYLRFALDLGADAVLRKPFNASALDRVLDVVDASDGRSRRETA